MHPDDEDKEPAVPCVQEGDIVHYVAYNQRNLAAIVLGQDGEGRCDLAVFTNMQNAAGEKNFGLQFHQNVVHHHFRQPGTWHKRQ